MVKCGATREVRNLISSIDIKSFRGIRNFKLDNLSQINILTGDNNCGKTSILEVLRSFGQPDNFFTWRTILRRPELRTIRRGISYYEGFYDLFDINSKEKTLEYTIEMENHITTVEMLGKETVEELTEEEIYRLQGMFYEKDEKEGNSLEVTQLIPKIKLRIRINGKRLNEISLYEGQITFPRATKDILIEEYSKLIIYISPTQHAEGNVFLNHILNTPDLYEEMLAVLKEYDEDIISINYDNDNDNPSGRGSYKILSKSHQKALPLNVYGDGMKKAILMMSAVVSAKNGVLLLDEFETAIHTSAMDRTFRWILESCKKLNVQVFLTSHSKEAIDKVLKCAPDLAEDITVYTMYKEGEKTSVRRLSAKKAIEVQDEMGLELR